MKKLNEHLEYDELEHKYFVDGKEVISVTQLMRKHKLSPDYSAVNEEVLKASAERGTFIHAEIEALLKNGESGFSNECENFAKYIKENPITNVKSEFAVYNDIVAGTVDLFFEQENVKIIADIKTTSTIHKDAVSWQLSIYNYLHEIKADKAQVFHFNTNGELSVVDVPLKKDSEVEELLNCERNGNIFHQLALFGEGDIAEFESIEDLIEELTAKKKEAEKREEEFKALAFAKMQENGITSIEQGRLKLTIVAPTTSTTIDTTKLKAEMPEVAEKYKKVSIRNGYVKITLRKS